jgi:hypothetical protein
MVHAAIYDAVNSISTVGQPYLYKTEAPDASVTHAIAHAAHDTLTAAFPGVDFTDELAGALAGAGADTGNGVALGKAAAAAMIASRTGDGSDDNTPYEHSTEPGHWRPTGSGPAATPNWGNVKPFTMTSGAQYRPQLPAGYSSMSALLASPEYTAQFNEVREFGKITSHVRTPDQTQAAFFWANDLDGTYKPPGQLFQHTQIVAAQRGLCSRSSAWPWVTRASPPGTRSTRPASTCGGRRPPSRRPSTTATPTPTCTRPGVRSPRTPTA